MNQPNILILNGPNLNLLGQREPEVYGVTGFEQYLEKLRQHFPALVLTYRQSNIEGELIDWLHRAHHQYQGVLLNAGGYTHTSVALRDAIMAIGTPVLEIHISNVHARESFRHHSYLSAVCCGVISGFGLYSYDMGLHYLAQLGRDGV